MMKRIRIKRIPLTAAQAISFVCWGVMSVFSAIAYWKPVALPQPAKGVLTVLLLAVAVLTMCIVLAPIEREDERARINQGRAAMAVLSVLFVGCIALVHFLGKSEGTLLVDRRLLLLCFTGCCTLYHGAFLCYERFGA